MLFVWYSMYSLVIVFAPREQNNTRDSEDISWSTAVGCVLWGIYFVTFQEAVFSVADVADSWVTYASTTRCFAVSFRP